MNEELRISVASKLHALRREFIDTEERMAPELRGPLWRCLNAMSLQLFWLEPGKLQPHLGELQRTMRAQLQREWHEERTIGLAHRIEAACRALHTLARATQECREYFACPDAPAPTETPASPEVG